MLIPPWYLVELHFDEIRDRLNDRTLIYLDVRNRSELLVDGKIVGSVNIPGTGIIFKIFKSMN